MVDQQINTIEVWKKIPEFPNYSVSSFGRIRRDTSATCTKAGRILSGAISCYGYRTLCLFRLGAHRQCFVHRIVASAFIPNPDGYPQVNHKNCIKTDNRVENLEWCTCAHNASHAVANGLTTKGRKRDPKYITRGDDHWMKKKPHLVLRGKEYWDARGNKPNKRNDKRRVWSTKLSVDEVKEIRRLGSCGTRQIEIAKRFNVTPSNISHIIRGVQWRRVS